MDKKKKFSFFDLSDDAFFTQEEKKENNNLDDQKVKEEIKTNDTSRINEAVEVFSKTQVVEQNIDNNKTINEAKIDDNLYPKVEEFVEKKNEDITTHDTLNNTFKIEENKQEETKIEYKIEEPKTEQVLRDVNPKINSLFDVEEKLDVKTNIYIKKWIYNEVEKIHLSTGKSRSAVINKLLEYALKGVK